MELETFSVMVEDLSAKSHILFPQSRGIDFNNNGNIFLVIYKSFSNFIPK